MKTLINLIRTVTLFIFLVLILIGFNMVAIRLLGIDADTMYYFNFFVLSFIAFPTCASFFDQSQNSR